MAENNNASSEVYNMNKEMINDVKLIFNPHYNLYQVLINYLYSCINFIQLIKKNMLQDKTSCFDRFYKTPSAYYECLETIDQKMAQNSTYLQKKFLSLEVFPLKIFLFPFEKYIFIQHFKSECEDQCKTDHGAFPKEFVDCMRNCCETMKNSSIATYQAFYEGQLGMNPDYKNIKI